VPWQPPFSEEDLHEAIAQAGCWVDVLRYLGYRAKGGNHRTVKRWAREWAISTDHFNPYERQRRSGLSRIKPLAEAMVENSSYHRGRLKERLLAEGIKQPVCEICGQGEFWNGRRMSLVLDHINGVSNDHRLENLRILCPNCNATLDTHCGRNLPRERSCAACGRGFAPRHIRHRYCSLGCWGHVHSSERRGVPQPKRRKVERPSYEQLKAELEASNFCAVGRKYGVSDNAVRKWVRMYERAAGEETEADAAQEDRG
jgi:hypothetical protein